MSPLYPSPVKEASAAHPEEGRKWQVAHRCFVEEGERRMASQAGMAKVLEAG